MTLQEQLDALRYQVEEPTVDCPCGCHRYIGEAGSLAHNYVECVQCRGISRIPDPRLAPLREVLRVPVPMRPDHIHKWGDDGVSLCTCIEEYVTRDVSDWPEWAVKGLVVGAAIDCGLLDPHPDGIRNIGQLCFWHDSAEECIAAVSEAVNALRKEKP